jgi:hypothetical protein
VTEFFESPAEPTGRSAGFKSAKRWGRPGLSTGVVPGVAPVECLLARTDDVAVSLSPIWVYPTGLEFRIHVDTEGADTDLDPFGRRRRRPGSGARDAPLAQLLFGFQFADGSKVTTLGPGHGRAADPATQSPMLLHRSGSSHGGHWTQKFWLAPSPPPGRLEFVCQWAAAGIPLTRVELDGAEIASARSRSRAIFSDGREVPE